MSSITSREIAACTADGNSAIRNTATSIRSVAVIPIVAAMANGSAVLGGALGVPIGLAIVRDSYLKGKEAYQCNDKEGMALSALGVTIGSSFTAVSGLLGAEGIMGLAGATVPYAFAPAMGGLGIGMYVAIGAQGVYGLVQTRSFAQKLKEQKNKFRWLKEQYKKDKNAFAFRTSPACAEKMSQFSKYPTVQQTRELIEEVEKANFKQQVKYAFFILVTLLGIAAFVAFLITTGPIAPALFAIGALGWLCIDSSRLHNFIGEKCWTWHRGDKQLESTCQTRLTA